MLKGYVKDAGGDPDTVAACVANPETEKRVRESMAMGEKLEVTSTPTLFINGRRVVGGSTIPYDVLKSMVDYYAEPASQIIRNEFSDQAAMRRLFLRQCPDGISMAKGLSSGMRRMCGVMTTISSSSVTFLVLWAAA